MSTNRNRARVAVGVIGVSAVAAAMILPGSVATAENTGDVTTDVTRAVLIQGSADVDISRTTLITQVNADGTGTASFTVPVIEGSSPKNMDSFGGPEVVDGQAQYDLDVDGAQVIRTSQGNFPEEDIPVTVSVAATLDGQPISMSDLAGQSGLVNVTYTFENTSSEPTQLSFKDARGNTITQEAEIPIPMGGSVNITYPESWGDVSAPTATTVSGDGSGNTLVSGTVALMPDTLPGQSTTGTFEIQARVTDAVVPPADIKFAVLPPDITPDLQDGRTTAEEGAEQAASIADAGIQLGEGATELQSGLATAADGARQIADGVTGQLGPGVTQLSDGLNQFYNEGIGALRESAEDLPNSVRSDEGFTELTDGFDAMNSAVDGVKEGLGVYKLKSSQKPGSWLKDNGEVDKSRADVARTLWSLVYGVRSIDVPTDRDNTQTVPNDNNGGLTNPKCDYDDPESATNPCGAWQVVDVVVQNLTRLGAGLGDIGTLLEGTGAAGINALAATLGCTVQQAPANPGPFDQTGPIVTGCPNQISVAGGNQNAEPIVGAVLGLLSQALYNPLQLDGTTPTDDSGLAGVLGTFYAELAIPTVNEGLVKLQRNVTTKLNGEPDLDTTKENTATGIVMNVRNNLALGGIGSDLYPGGRCEGYKKAGDPSSGINPDADADRVSETCAAADVLNIAGKASAQIEDGVSTTLLEGIRDTLLEGVGTYFVGCDTGGSLACAAGTLAAGGVTLNEGVNGAQGLAFGTSALADGLPAAVEGAGRIRTDAAEPLAEAGNDGSKTAGLAIATLDALQARADAGAGIPGGAPEGVTSYGGVYAFALNGAGGSATENAARAGLGFLALIAAGGIGAVLANRAGG